MLIHEIVSQRPRTPAQARIDTLKNASKLAKERLNNERKRQRVQRAQANLQKALSS